MKKSVFAIICLLIAVLFAGCSAPVPKIANYYKFGYLSQREDGLLESLVYSVKADYEDTLSIKPPFALTGEGTYTVNLYKEQEEYKFKIETVLNFRGKYYFPANESYSQEFDDTVQSTAYSYIYNENFSPISTVKTFDISLPVFENDAYTMKKAYFTAESTYSGNSVTSKITDNPDYADAYKVESDTNRNFTAEIKERFVDNEFITLAIRLQALSTSFTDSFKVPHSLYGIIQTISFKASENTEAKPFKDPSDPEKQKNFDCIVISSTLAGKYTGKSIYMYFTNDYSVKYKQGNEERNQNISLMVEFKQENLIYTLTDYQNYAEKF